MRDTEGRLIKTTGEKMASLEDEKRLRRQLRKKPEDLAHRGIYADLLEELGEEIGAKIERDIVEELALLPKLRGRLAEVRSTIEVEVPLDCQSGCVRVADNRRSLLSVPSALLKAIE